MTSRWLMDEIRMRTARARFEAMERDVWRRRRMPPSGVPYFLAPNTKRSRKGARDA